MMSDELLPEQQLARALSHPLRARVLRALTTSDASPVELAKALDEPLNTVSYHVRFLDDLGLLDLVRTTPRRGAVEHHYRARMAPIAEGEGWTALPEAGRQSVLGQMFREAASEVDTALVGQGDTGAESIVELAIDRQGAAELRDALSSLRAAILRIDGESDRRCAGADGLRTVRVTMLVADQIVPAGFVMTGDHLT